MHTRRSIALLSLSLLSLTPVARAQRAPAARRVGACTVGPERVLVTTPSRLNSIGGQVAIGPSGALAVWLEGAAGRAIALDANGAPTTATPRPIALSGDWITDVLPLGTGFVVITRASCRAQSDCYKLQQTDASGAPIGEAAQLNVGSLQYANLAAAPDGSLLAMLLVPSRWQDPMTVVEVRSSPSGARLRSEEIAVPQPSGCDGEPQQQRYSLVADANRWGFIGPLRGAAGGVTLAMSGNVRGRLPVAVPSMTAIAGVLEGASLRYVVVEGPGVRGTSWRSGVLSADGSVRPDAAAHANSEALPAALRGNESAVARCDGRGQPVSLLRAHALYGAWGTGPAVTVATARTPTGLANMPLCSVASRDNAHLALWSDFERRRWRLHVAPVRCDPPSP
jgi:hypothetical protein